MQEQVCRAVPAGPRQPFRASIFDFLLTCRAHIPSVLPSSPLNGRISLLAIVTQKLKVPPVLERARAVACQEEEHGHSNVWYQVHGQQQHKLGNLTEGKGRIDRGARRLAKSANRIVHGIFREGPVLADEVFIAFVHQYGVEHVDLRLVLCLVSSMPTSANPDRVLATKKDSNSKATTAAPSPRTRNTALTHALPAGWNSLRKRTCGSRVQKKSVTSTNRLRRKAGSSRALSSGYRNGCARKKTTP